MFLFGKLRNKHCNEIELERRAVRLPVETAIKHCITNIELTDVSTSLIPELITAIHAAGNNLHVLTVKFVALREQDTIVFLDNCVNLFKCLNRLKCRIHIEFIIFCNRTPELETMFRNQGLKVTSRTKFAWYATGTWK